MEACGCVVVYAQEQGGWRPRAGIPRTRFIKYAKWCDATRILYPVWVVGGGW